MKRYLLIILITLLTAVGTGLCRDNEDMWTENPGMHPKPEIVERVLDRIAQNDPELAEELRALHESNPDAFRKRIIELIQAQRTPGPDDERLSPPGMEPEGRKDREGRGERGGGRMGLASKGRMDRHVNEYMDWLRENYPEEHETLSALREKEEATFHRRFELSLRKYGRIMSIQKRNPELAEVLKEDLVLKERRDEILEEVRFASAEEKDALKAELNAIVSTRFDLIVRQKELQYQSLLRKLEELEAEIEKRQQEVNSLIERKPESVESRVAELLNETEQINWD